MVDYYPLTDQVIAQILGQRLRALRLRRNRTQAELAAATTLSLGTLKALETGKGKLESLIAVLRELGALEALDAFLPEPRLSPLDLAKRQGRERRRASVRRRAHPEAHAPAGRQAVKGSGTGEDEPW